jgi:hypothetical protein
MIEVFTTDVSGRMEAEYICRLLEKHFPDAIFNIDVEDCDKVLRAEGTFSASAIINIILKQGFQCAIMN